MIKPKTQQFRVKVMLIKLQAVNNRVATRCHASLKLDGEELFFKVTPELKKNVAVFNSQIELDNFSIQLDEVTGLYEAKSCLLQFQLQTQGTRMKMGEVGVNMGGVLNQKKYRIVNQYPLAKCYDKTAKVRLSVDFIPMGGPEHFSDKKQKRELKSLNVSQTEVYTISGMKEKRTPPIKSRLAQESIPILQQRIYEYEQKMENYRLSQTQLQQKMHEQISHKDEQLTELTVQVNRKSQQLSASTLQIQQLKFRIKEQIDEASSLKEQKRSLTTIVENQERTEQSLKKELSTLKSSLQNQTRTKQNKEKYYNQELTKYTTRYLESEQERNKIIFELETKFKEEMDKKEGNYRSIIASSEKKYEGIISSFRERSKKLEMQILNNQEKIEENQGQIANLQGILDQRDKDLGGLKQKYNQLNTEFNKLKQTHTQTISQLQTQNFSYNQLNNDLQRSKDDLSSTKKHNEQLKMQLIMANQTIEQQYKSITKCSKELQVHQERQYFLTQKYNDDMEVKSINEENIRGESHYYRGELQMLRNKLRIEEQRADDEGARVSELTETIRRVQSQLSQRGQTIMKIGEERINLDNQCKSLRNQLSEMEEAVMILRQENMELNDMLRQKKAALENDKSLEWSYKIEELQNDIGEMVEKFRVEKEGIREGYRREENKKKDEINQLNHLIRKLREESEEGKKQLQRKEFGIKELEKTIEGLKVQMKDRGKEYEDLQQKMRQSITEYQQVQKRGKQTESSSESRVRQMETKNAKLQSKIKKLQQARSGHQKIVQTLLQYLARPVQSVASFQEIFVPEVQMQFLNLINLSIRKYCDERTKLKEHIKKLQTDSQANQAHSFNKIDIQSFKHREKSITSEKGTIKEASVKNYQSQFQHWKQPTRNNYQVDQLRDQNGRLKREISELKIKMRTIEEEVARAQRGVDVERQDKNEVKRQLEEVQDEVDRLSFQLKRKEKLILQFQNEVKQLQEEIVSIRSAQPTSSSKPMPVHLSRAQMRMRQKQEAQLNNRREIIIKQLQGRLQGKSKQLEDTMSQMSKLRSDNTALKEGVMHLSSQVKLLENKYRDRCSKYATQEAMFIETKGKLEDEINRITLQHKQAIQTMAEQLQKIQEKNMYEQRNSQHLAGKLEEIEKKLKMVREEGRGNQSRGKKEHQMAMVQLRDEINQLEGRLAVVQSQRDQLQLRQKQEGVRASSQAVILSKRSQQIDRLASEVRSKQQKIFSLQQSLELLKSQSDSKILQLRQLIEQFQIKSEKKQFEIEQLRFISQGRLLDLQRQLEQFQGES